MSELLFTVWIAKTPTVLLIGFCFHTVITGRVITRLSARAALRVPGQQVLLCWEQAAHTREGGEHSWREQALGTMLGHKKAERGRETSKRLLGIMNS